jgi:hypothetical protein
MAHHNLKALATRFHNARTGAGGLKFHRMTPAGMNSHGSQPYLRERTAEIESQNLLDCAVGVTIFE